jgi:hypothetical protein
MTCKWSYSSDAACVLECVRQAKCDAAFLVLLCPSLRLGMFHVDASSACTLVLKGHSINSPALQRRDQTPFISSPGGTAEQAPSAFPNPKLTLDLQINPKIKPVSYRIRPKNKAPIAHSDSSPLRNVSSLLKAIKGYSRLVKPFLRILFLAGEAAWCSFPLSAFSSLCQSMPTTPGKDLGRHPNCYLIVTHDQKPNLLF